MDHAIGCRKGSCRSGPLDPITELLRMHLITALRRFRGGGGGWGEGPGGERARSSRPPAAAGAPGVPPVGPGPGGQRPPAGPEPEHTRCGACTLPREHTPCAGIARHVHCPDNTPTPLDVPPQGPITQASRSAIDKPTDLSLPSQHRLNWQGAARTMRELLGPSLYLI
jgi:hypothetical protein